MLNDGNLSWKLLKSVAANYPILRKMGYAISGPIVIVAEEKDFSSLLNCTKNFFLPRLEDCLKNEYLQESANADFCWTIYRPRGSEKKLDQAADYAVQSYVDFEVASPPVLILADGRILRNSDINFIFIFAEKLKVEEIALEEVVPEDGELSLVFEKIEETVPGCRTQTEQAFVAAACFLFPAYWRKGLQREFPQVIEWARSLAEQSEVGIEGIAELFIEEAYRWQAQEKDLVVFFLPELGLEGVKRIQKAVYADPINFYLSNELFKMIEEPLLKIFADEQIKAALVKEEILLPENEKTFMAKMNFRSVAGTYERKRMLKFSREKFNQDGDIEFVSACLMERKDEGNVD